MIYHGSGFVNGYPLLNRGCGHECGGGGIANAAGGGVFHINANREVITVPFFNARAKATRLKWNLAVQGYENGWCKIKNCQKIWPYLHNTRPR